MMHDKAYDAYRSSLSCLSLRFELHLLEAFYIVLEGEVKTLFQSEMRPIKQCISYITKRFVTVKTDIYLVLVLILSILLEMD